MISGLRYSRPRRCRSATSPERLSYSTPNSDAIQAPISRVEQGETARTHATSFSCCASLRTQALPPASNRISAVRAALGKRAMPATDRVVVQQKNPPHLLAAQAIVEQHQRIGAPSQPMRHRTVARQPDQCETLISRQEARANHALKRIQLNALGKSFSPSQ